MYLRQIPGFLWASFLGVQDNETGELRLPQGNFGCENAITVKCIALEGGVGGGAGAEQHSVPPALQFLQH